MQVTWVSDAVRVRAVDNQANLPSVIILKWFITR